MADGITYFGDGNWGIVASDCDAASDGDVGGILELQGNINHVWIVKTTPTTYEIYPVAVNGTQIYPSTNGVLPI